MQVTNMLFGPSGVAQNGNINNPALIVGKQESYACMDVRILSKYASCGMHIAWTLVSNIAYPSKKNHVSNCIALVYQLVCS